MLMNDLREESVAGRTKLPRELQVKLKKVMDEGRKREVQKFNRFQYGRGVDMETVVVLGEQTCSCGKYQEDLFPWEHAGAAIVHRLAQYRLCLRRQSILG